eukprot:COSAG02_NODE_40434_length_405_cov_1.715686_1_plen_70_part_10
MPNGGSIREWDQYGDTDWKWNSFVDSACVWNNIVRIKLIVALEGRAGQDWAWQGWAGLGRAGQGRAGRCC